MDDATRAAAAFWLRHGDDEAFRRAKRAARDVLARLPDLVGERLRELTADDTGLVVAVFPTDVKGHAKGQKTYRERVVLLGRAEWLAPERRLLAGAGFAVREQQNGGEDPWAETTLPFYGVRISGRPHQPDLMRGQCPGGSWDDWGTNWKRFPLTLTEEAWDPAGVYTERAAGLVHDLGRPVARRTRKPSTATGGSEAASGGRYMTARHI
jgi:hypothetical protein